MVSGTAIKLQNSPPTQNSAFALGNGDVGFSYTASFKNPLAYL
jgi:hypothetical protein